MTTLEVVLVGLALGLALGALVVATAASRSRAEHTELVRWMRSQEQINRDLYEIDRAMYLLHGIPIPKPAPRAKVPPAFERAFAKDDR